VHGLVFQHILFADVESGEATARFFDPMNRVEVLHACAEAGAGMTNWHTVLLGLHGVSSFPDPLREIARALALRLWMRRQTIASRWPEPAYRILFSMQDAIGDCAIHSTLDRVQKRWGSAWAQLRALESVEKGRLSDASYLPAPGVVEIRMQDMPGVWPTLFAWLGGAPLVMFFRENDPYAVQGWVGDTHARLSGAVTQGWLQADQRFAEERQRLFENSSSLIRLKQTPADIVSALEQRLDALDAFQQAPVAQVELHDEIGKARQTALTRLKDAIRSRPSLRMALLCALVALLLLGGLDLLHHPWKVTVAGVVTTGSAAKVGGWIWYAGSGCMLVMAFAWALYWCQQPLLEVIATCLAKIGSLWQRAASAHEHYVARLNRLLERIVTVHNLNVARAELDARNLKLARMAYHANLLASYYAAYVGGQIEGDVPDDERPLIDAVLSEDGNPAYFWGFPGANLKLSGRAQASLPLPVSELSDPRLAGLASVEVRCIDPHGRTMPTQEPCA
jgi:hypothetical protein